MEDFFDDVKDFFSGILESIADFFSGLFSNNDEQDDTETFMEEECIDAVNETEMLEDTECTCNACVICTNATEESEPIHMKKDDVVIHIGDIGRLNKLDVEMDGHFLGCKMADECCVDKESIEGGMWQEVDDGNDEGEDKETLNRDNSYMICTKYAGIIYFYDDGQNIRDNQDEIIKNYGKLHTSPQGIEMIANFELSEESVKAWGLGEFDENGNLIGIYPYYVFKKDKNGNYVSDGGITFGYGHWISKEGYDESTDNQKLINQYATGASFSPNYIPNNGIPYKVPNSSYISVEKAQELLNNDIQSAEKAVNNFLDANDIELNPNQFDALVSFTHQYGENWWIKEDKLMPKFIREGGGTYDPEEVRDVFAQHDYKERRAVEAEVFINGYE